MDGQFSDGVLSTILKHIDPELRPFAEVSFLALIVAAAIAAALNPIFELGQRLLRLGRVITDGMKWIWYKIVPPPPPPPPPPNPEKAPIPPEITIWEQRAPTKPTYPNANGIPIITVANMKGGVGKTTIVANLAAHYRKKLQKPVLIIDFDYQGSLSQTVRTEAGYTDPDMTAHILITEGYAGEDPMMYAREMRRGLEDIFVFPANYPFATIENNLLADWLQRPESDLMYRLCPFLRRADVQSKFGIVLIDCPPRLTAGSMNALCASTHLLVPSSLDEMSAQAAEYFLGQISRMKQVVFPSLKVLGIVPSIIYRDAQYLEGEARALDRLKRYGEKYWNREDFVLAEGRIPRRADISNTSGAGVPYLHRPAVRQIFDRLGAEIEQRR